MEKLIKQALEARKYSYAPYSGFMVGAALECMDGSIYTGCNIENASYTPTNCAERTAFFKAVSEGVREFRRIAIVGGKEDGLTDITPCGVCLQVMSEFCDPEHFKIIMAKSEDDYVCRTLGEMLPMQFSLMKG